MQTTHKIPGSSATSWSTYLVSQSSRGDYYLKEGEEGESVPTQWHGPDRLLRSYGIDPSRPVQLEHLRSLMHGVSPATGEPIRPVGADGTRTAGIDLTFSPPKDVSALWATSSDYRRAQIEAAHRKAVKSALERTEREVALVRRKSDGVVRFEKAQRLVAMEAVHTTSRLARDQTRGSVPDPQLHSHVTVIAAQRRDGKLAAVESRRLMLAARENGAWYRAELAMSLKELGVAIERRTGNDERYFGIRGVSKELAEQWSSRSEDVERAAKIFRSRYGREPKPKELDSLTLGTRGSKSSARPIDVNEAWRALGAEHGQTVQRSEEIFNDWGLRNEQVSLAKELVSEATKDRSTISERELKAKAYELSAGACRPEQADKLIDALTREGELIELNDRTWTTRELREAERTMLDTAKSRAGEPAAPVSEEALQDARRETVKQIKAGLTSEQREALETVTGTGGVSVLVGRAGTGKGVVIATAANAWRAEGNEVIGTAIAGATAQRLAHDAKLGKALTTDALIARARSGKLRIDNRTVVVMDEVGMADSRRLAALTKLTAKHEAKLVLVGDQAQLQAIGAGGMFSKLQENVPKAELTEVHRARHEWERKAWEQIRTGEPGPALAQYKAHDRLHIHDTRAQAAKAMVDHWDKTRTTAEGKTVMITDASNKERDQINAIAQERRAKARELGTERVELPDKPYDLRAGDEIIFTAQYHPHGEKRIENGITGTIQTAARQDSRVTIKTNEPEQRDVSIDTNEFSNLSLAYAVHVHKAQGMTAETAGIMVGGWQTDRESTYVAISRAREQTQIHVSRDDLGEQGLDPGAIERLADRIERSNAEEASITKEPADRATDRDQTPTRDQTPERDQTIASEHQTNCAERDDRDLDREQEVENDHDRSQDAEHDRDNDLGFGIE